MQIYFVFLWQHATCYSFPLFCIIDMVLPVPPIANSPIFRHSKSCTDNTCQQKHTLICTHKATFFMLYSNTAAAAVSAMTTEVRTSQQQYGRQFETKLILRQGSYPNVPNDNNHSGVSLMSVC